MQLDHYKIECTSCELLFSCFFFCNQWKSAAWWLQDRVSVVWDFFKDFFATNRNVQLDGYTIGCRSSDLFFQVFFFFFFSSNQWKSAAWWLQDRMSVVWAFFFQVFFCFATNGKVQLDGYKIGCWSCELFFKPFFATNGNVQLDGYKVKCVGLVG